MIFDQRDLGEVDLVYIPKPTGLATTLIGIVLLAMKISRRGAEIAEKSKRWLSAYSAPLRDPFRLDV